MPNTPQPPSEGARLLSTDLKETAKAVAALTAQLKASGAGGATGAKSAAGGGPTLPGSGSVQMGAGRIPNLGLPNVLAPYQNQFGPPVATNPANPAALAALMGNALPAYGQQYPGFSATSASLPARATPLNPAGLPLTAGPPNYQTTMGLFPGTTIQSTSGTPPFGPTTSTPTGGPGGLRGNAFVRGVVGMSSAALGQFYQTMSQALPAEQQSEVDLSRLQTQLGNRQSYRDFYNRSVTRQGNNAISEYGYTRQDIMQAMGTYMPYNRGPGNIQDINRFVGFGESSGLGLQGTTDYAAQLARSGVMGMGRIGGMQQGLDTSTVLAITAMGQAQSAIAKPADWSQGMADLITQQKQLNINFTPEAMKSTMGYYSALNQINNPAFAGTAGAQFLGSVSQGIVESGNASGPAQALGMSALGIYDPYEYAEATSRGLFAGKLPGTGRYVNTLQRYIQAASAVGGSREEKAGVLRTLIPTLSQAQAIDAFPFLQSIANQVGPGGVAGTDVLMKAMTSRGIDPNSTGGAQSFNMFARIQAAGGDRSKLNDAMKFMLNEGVTKGQLGGLIDSKGNIVSATGAAQLEDVLGKVYGGAGNTGTTSQAGTVQSNMNAIGGAALDAAGQVEKLRGAAQQATARLLDIPAQHGGVANIGFGLGSLANIGNMFAGGMMLSGSMAMMNKVLGPLAGSITKSILARIAPALAARIATQAVTTAATTAGTTAVAGGTTAAVGGGAIAAGALPAAAILAIPVVLTGVIDIFSDAGFKNKPGMRAFLSASQSGDVKTSNGGTWQLTTRQYGIGKEVLTDNMGNDFDDQQVGSITKTKGLWVLWDKQGGGHLLGESISDPPSKYVSKPVAKPRTGTHPSVRPHATHHMPATTHTGSHIVGYGPGHEPIYGPAPGGGSSSSSAAPNARTIANGLKSFFGNTPLNLQIDIALKDYTLEVTGGTAKFANIPVYRKTEQPRIITTAQVHGGGKPHK